MTFRPKGSNLEVPKMHINNVNLKNVDKHKYLGVTITRDGKNKADIERAENDFLSQFYSFYRKFHYVDISILLFLFNSLCSSFYGSELWFNLKGCSKEIKKIAVTYHNCIKKIVKVSKRESNHLICNSFNLMVFEHFLNFRIILFAIRILKSCSPCVLGLKSYFKDSFLIKRASLILLEKYGISSFDNDLDTTKSRILFVQYREEQSR